MSFSSQHLRMTPPIHLIYIKTFKWLLFSLGELLNLSPSFSGKRKTTLLYFSLFIINKLFLILSHQVSITHACNKTLLSLTTYCLFIFNDIRDKSLCAEGYIIYSLFSLHFYMSISMNYFTIYFFCIFS